MARHVLPWTAASFVLIVPSGLAMFVAHASDFIGNPYSCIVDAKSTNVVDGTLLKVSGWYDNEWGYSSRCVDLLRYVGARL